MYFFFIDRFLKEDKVKFNVMLAWLLSFVFMFPFAGWLWLGMYLVGYPLTFKVCIGIMLLYALIVELIGIKYLYCKV